MGVPAFFRWLSQRCPMIISDASEPEKTDTDNIFESSTSGNPAIDNLYLDMNGIIHPCCHPENIGVPIPTCEEDCFNNMFKYLDRVIGIINPRKLIYFAIDGVAPRAKMNQQRSRRFRAAQESKQTAEKRQQLLSLWKAKGVRVPDNIAKKSNYHFDSNVITPGTPFMARLANVLKFYITERLNNDPKWRDLRCIFSDAGVPGEGEHKILEFIRVQRASPDYNPNTRHCIYGADADLIMLGLSTHEPHFYIFRETIMTPAERQKILSEVMAESRPQNEGEFHEKAAKEIIVHFQFAKLSVVREYFDMEFKNLHLPFEYDLERILDDFVFMCFFVGNDFIPHLPMLSIRDGGIDCLLYLYKRMLPCLRGYLTDNGELNLMRIDVFLNEIAHVEEAIVKNNKQREDYFASVRQRNEQEKQQGNGGPGGSRQNNRKDLSAPAPPPPNPVNDKNKAAADKLKADLKKSLIKPEESPKTEEAKQPAPSNATSMETEPVITKADIDAHLTVERMKSIEETMMKREFSSEPGLKQETSEAYSEAKSDSSKYTEKFLEGITLKPSISLDSVKSIGDTFEAPKDTKHKKRNSVTNVLERGTSLENADLGSAEELNKMSEGELERKFRDILSSAFLVKEAPGAPNVEGALDANYKEKYYREKFRINAQDFWEFKNHIRQAYIEAISWNFAYYYKGCISWKYYYSYHYAPFPSDITGIGSMKINFEYGKPFRPLDQLLAVLPPDSGHALPASYKALMTDPSSPILDFYPTDFICDTKGKKFAWMGEVLLPFMEEERLLRCIHEAEKELNEEENERNAPGITLLYTHKDSLFFGALPPPVRDESSPPLTSSREEILHSPNVYFHLEHQQNFMAGTLIGHPKSYRLGSIIDRPFHISALDSFGNNQVVSFVYINPPTRKHESRILPGVEMPHEELNDYIFENLDRKFNAGSRAIKMLEKALGDLNDPDEVYLRGRNTEDLIDDAIEDAGGVRREAAIEIERPASAPIIQQRPSFNNFFSQQQGQNTRKDLTRPNNHQGGHHNNRDRHSDSRHHHGSRDGRGDRDDRRGDNRGGDRGGERGGDRRGDGNHHHRSRDDNGERGGSDKRREGGGERHHHHTSQGDQHRSRHERTERSERTDRPEGESSHHKRHSQNSDQKLPESGGKSLTQKRRHDEAIPTSSDSKNQERKPEDDSDKGDKVEKRQQTGSQQ